MPKDRGEAKEFHRVTTSDTSSTELSEETKEVEKAAASGGKETGYLGILDDVAGSLKAVLLDSKDKEIKKIPVRELTDELQKGKDIQTVVFDGIITQRLLDIAHSKNIKNIVGVKMGNVVKKPKTVRVITRRET
ncbi:MAG TPA: hypothetical protein ENI44_04775 [Thermoplasmatales archaeon]|nr:hypothetical protein [Thermoplasmatales archaeon]